MIPTSITVTVVWERFEKPSLPTVTEANSSSPEIERDIVAQESYGRQPGRVIDALDVLIHQRPERAPKHPALDDFLSLSRKINEIKSRSSASRIERIKADLARLKKDSPEGYHRIASEMTLDATKNRYNQGGLQVCFATVRVTAKVAPLQSRRPERLQSAVDGLAGCKHGTCRALRGEARVILDHQAERRIAGQTMSRLQWLARPVRWDYFYDEIGRSVVGLVRRLLALRGDAHEFRRGAHFFYNEFERYQSLGVLLFSRYQGPRFSLVALNFGKVERTMPFWFPMDGDYVEQLTYLLFLKMDESAPCTPTKGL